MKWTAEAPSNLALIKYMGKSDSSRNRPTNSSLSVTLNSLFTRVEIEKTGATGFGATWEPLSGLEPLNLSEKGQAKFLKHFEFLAGKMSLKGQYVVRSGNNFPAACGLASSASSFAALTKCASKVAAENGLKFSDIELSALSQLGSGSSCRSFFSPWSIWTSEGAQSMNLPFGDMNHMVVLAAKDEKEVSSSQAHLRVLSSLNFEGRVARAEKRLSNLMESLRKGQWQEAFETVWAEFWDMHSLFETSTPSFGYMNSRSIATLELARLLWQENQDGPLVTMDAGPNVHLLFRSDQRELQYKWRKAIEGAGLEIWSSRV